MITNWLGRILGAAAGLAVFFAVQSSVPDNRRSLVLAACVMIGVILGGIIDLRRQSR
jgi:hypothetical protein